jgi:hypothetical protein
MWLKGTKRKKVKDERGKKGIQKGRREVECCTVCSGSSSSTVNGGVYHID